MKMSVGRSCRPCLSLIAPPGLRPAPCGTLPLAPRAAGARVVSATPRVLVCIEAHDVGGREVAPHLLGHEAHGRVDVVKEVLEAGAQVVEPGSPEGVDTQRRSRFQAKRDHLPLRRYICVPLVTRSG